MDGVNQLRIVIFHPPTTLHNLTSTTDIVLSATSLHIRYIIHSSSFSQHFINPISRVILPTTVNSSHNPLHVFVYHPSQYRLVFFTSSSLTFQCGLDTCIVCRTVLLLYNYGLPLGPNLLQRSQRDRYYLQRCLSDISTAVKKPKDGILLDVNNIFDSPINWHSLLHVLNLNIGRVF